DTSFIMGLDEEALTHLQKLADGDGRGVSLVYFMDVESPLPDEFIDFSSFEDKDTYHNDHSHAVGGIHVGSGEVASKERVWEELERRGVPLRKGMRHTPRSFERLALGSKTVLLK
ncbi:hypothetical protein PFISCL1PPCAC_5298, partial [Pristionchus fissidentatus]